MRTTFASLRGRVVRVGSDAHEGWLPGGAVVPLPGPSQAIVLDLEITDDGGGHYLLVYNAQNADLAGDTWHETLDEAFDAAELNFGIARSEWKYK
jgi:hypothetical protein